MMFLPRTIAVYLPGGRSAMIADSLGLGWSMPAVLNIHDLVLGDNPADDRSLPVIITRQSKHLCRRAVPGSDQSIRFERRTE